MNGVLRPDTANIVMIGLIAFPAVWLIDRAVRKLGYPSWTTSGS